MNIRCPNCGAVFPPARDADTGGEVECPLCLVNFAPEAAETVSASKDSLPPASDETGTAPLGAADEFETFGSSSGMDTVSLGSSAANPFADPGGSDPFGGGMGGGIGGGDDDPFASPGGGEEGANVDFGALLGALDDSDAAIDHGAATQMVDREQAAAVFGAQDDDSLFGTSDAAAEDGDSLFLATANTSGAVFDAEDDGDDDDDDRFDQDPIARNIEPMAPRLSPEEEAAQRPKPRTGPRIAILLLVLLCGGITMDYMGIPAFGLGSLDEENVERAPDPRARPVAKNLIQATRLDDTKNKYLLEISRLEQVSASMPGDMETKQQHLARLLDLYERFPDEFSADPHLAAQVEAYQQTISPFPKRFDVLKLVANGDLDKIEPKLVALADGKAASPDDVSAAVLGVLDVWRR